jgi:DNA-binding response OmpR family regulator
MLEAPKYILVVEDEEDISDLIKDQFSDFKYIKFHLSDNLPDAIQKIQRQHYDIMIVDIKLKKGLGTDLILRAKNAQKGLNTNTPIFVTSGHLDQDLLSTIKNSIQGAFIKPYDFLKLRNTVLKHLNINPNTANDR